MKYYTAPYSSTARERATPSSFDSKYFVTRDSYHLQWKDNAMALKKYPYSRNTYDHKPPKTNCYNTMECTNQLLKNYFPDVVPKEAYFREFHLKRSPSSYT